jgi:hypothetical protein
VKRRQRVGNRVGRKLGRIEDGRGQRRGAPEDFGSLFGGKRRDEGLESLPYDTVPESAVASNMHGQPLSITEMPRRRP